MEKTAEMRRHSTQPGLVMAVIALFFVIGAMVFSGVLVGAAALLAAAGLALMFLPALGFIIFALYESPVAAKKRKE